MKLFSNFDTAFKENTIRDHQQEFGEANVLVVQKSKLFRFVYVFAPIISYLFIAAAAIYVVIEWIDGSTLKYGVIGFAVLILLMLSFPIIGKYITYKMDFLVVTPKMIIKYDQEGFFERDIKTMSSSTIKTVTVKKDGVLKSIFNNGDILFLSAGGEEHGEGHILCRYVKRPEQVRYRVSQIIKRETTK